VTPTEPTRAVSVEALGVIVRIDAGPALSDELERTWARCRAADAGVPDVVIDAASMASSAPVSSAADLLERITQQVTVQAITARAGRLLMLHACAVAAPSTGRVVVCVGPSGVGKTTLASVLGRRWSYVTDETVALDESGAVLPYPKPLSVRQGGGSAKRQVSPEELGLGVVAGRLHPAAVLLLERRPDVEDLELERVPTVPAVALLAEHTSYLSRMEQPLRSIAGLLHRTGGLQRVVYAEGEQLVPLVEELLGDAS
jgi:hypothetical protein